jgi:hypothetical protein
MMRLKPSPGKTLSVEKYLASFPGTVQTYTNSLRDLIKQTVPGVIERVYPGWKLIGYRVQRGNRSFYFGFLAPFKDHIILGFEYGTMLSDPHGVLEGNGSQVRQVVVRTKTNIKEHILTPLILEAASIATGRNKRKR